MNKAAQSLPKKPPVTKEISDYMRAIGAMGGGFRNISRAARSAFMKAIGKRIWEVRRQRHGPTGRRDNSLKTWNREHPKAGEQQGGSQ